jgi:hypothetical protein
MTNIPKVAQIWHMKAKLKEMEELGAPPKEIEKLEEDIISLQTDNLSIFDEEELS